MTNTSTYINILHFSEVLAFKMSYEPPNVPDGASYEAAIDMAGMENASTPASSPLNEELNEFMGKITMDQTE